MDHWSAETFGKARGPPTDSQLNNRPGNGFNQTHGRCQEGHEGDQQDACLRFRVKANTGSAHVAWKPFEPAALQL